MSKSEWTWEIKISPELREWYVTHSSDQYEEVPNKLLDEKTWTWMSLPVHLCKILTDVYLGKSKEDRFWWNDDPEASCFDKKTGGVWFDLVLWDTDAWKKICIKNKGEKPTGELPIFIHNWSHDPHDGVVRVVSSPNKSE